MPEVLLPRNYFVFVAVLTAQFGIFLSGVFYSWSSPVLVKLSSLDDNPLRRIITSTDQVWIVTIGVFGMWIGCGLSGELSRRIGRRPSLILMTLPSLISFVILAFLKEIWLMHAARFLGGVTNGGMFTILPIYFGEVSDTRNRGILGAALSLFLNVGLLFSLCIGPFTTYRTFNLILAFCVFIYAILITLIIPESPYYFIEKDLENKAEAILKKIRGEEDVKQELKQIQQYVQMEAKQKCSFFEMIKTKTARKSLTIGIGLCCFQQCSGITIIMGFGQMIFEEVEGFIPSHLSLIIVGISQVIFGLMAPFFTARFGRRTLLILSYAGISVSLIAFGFYFILKQYEISVDTISWLPLISILFFMFVFCIGAGAVTFIVIGEIFPSKLKGMATSVANILASLTGLILVDGYKIVEKNIGTGYAFWILGLLGFCAQIFCIHFVVETRGKTLKEIQEILSENKSIESQMLPLEKSQMKI